MSKKNAWSAFSSPATSYTAASFYYSTVVANTYTRQNLIYIMIMKFTIYIMTKLTAYSFTLLLIHASKWIDSDAKKIFSSLSRVKGCSQTVQLTESSRVQCASNPCLEQDLSQFNIFTI
jgi:hypothetical protein